jgi:L-2,4-diaminobutyrate decarboxylase
VSTQTSLILLSVHHRLYGGSWQEGAGAVFAENQALRWLSDMVGFPQTSGGVFVQGGTIGNLSALVVARDQARKAHPDVTRWVIACSAESHSSITSAAHVMDVDVLKIETNGELRLDGAHVGPAIDELHATTSKRVFAIVGTAGSTNLGVVDDLASLAQVAKERKIWFHVDGAYGLAGICAPSVRRSLTVLNTQIHLSSTHISGSLHPLMPAHLSIEIQHLLKRRIHSMQVI